LKPRDNAASLPGGTVFGKATQLLAEAAGANEIERKIAAMNSFRL